MTTYFLYQKESPLGLKYVGMTTRNPYKYYGSGKYWRRHLNKHKFGINDIKTTILYASNIEKEVNEFALAYSTQNNIVESQDFANLMPESGIDSVRGRKMSEKTRDVLKYYNTNKKLSLETIEKILRNRTSTKGKKHSEETKLKISSARKGLKLSQPTKDKMKLTRKRSNVDWSFRNYKIYQYELDGNFINEFNSLSEASKMTNVLICSISACILKTRNVHTAGNFQWRNRYYEKIDKFDKHTNAINNSKKIYQYDLIENFIKEWNGTKEPSLELNINRGSIRNCLCKITKSAGGFIWKYNCHNEKIQNEKV